MQVGYARVSTTDQDPSLQLNALEQAGCWPIYEARVSGKAGVANDIRKQALAELVAGDSFVVWRLDRAGRSLSELLSIVDDLERRNIKFRSLTENIDTRTPQGRFFFQLLAAFAEWERNVIIERTKEGKAAARKAGKPAGGPRLFGTPGNGVSEAQAEREADLLRHAAQHVLNGGTLRRLANDWNRDGVPTRTGTGRWTITSIRRILTNPRMISILGLETFHELELLFMPAEARQHQGAPAVHLLSGILQCAACEQPMYVMVGSSRHVSYRCRLDSSRLNKPLCGGVSVAAESAEKHVVELMMREVTSQQFAKRLAAKRGALVQTMSPRELHDARGELQELEQIMTTRYFAPHQTRYEELQRKVRAATRQLVQRTDLQLLRDLPKDRDTLEAAWKAWDTAQRRRLLKFVFTSVKVKASGRTGRKFNPERLVPEWRV